MTVSVERSIQQVAPTEEFSGDVPLVAVMRGEYVSAVHRGVVVVCRTDGSQALALGDASQPVFLRSAAKPFQVMPAVLSGAIERFDITDRELAVLCASHSGEPRHQDAVLSVLEKIGLPESALRCGTHPPLHQPTALKQVREGREPSPVCNNCSGAHAGMLVARRQRDWPVENYGDPNHPLQLEIRRVLASFAGMKRSAVQFAVDNCAVPTFRLPIHRSAQAFARLASGQGVDVELREAAARVKRAMTSHPEMVGGEDRFDTDLMAAMRGAVVAKGGAEGFEGVGLIERELGLAMKVSDGDSRCVGPVVMRVLDYLQVLGHDAVQQLRAYAFPDVRNMRDEQVGRLVTLFELGDAG